MSCIDVNKYQQHSKKKKKKRKKRHLSKNTLGRRKIYINLLLLVIYDTSSRKALLQNQSRLQLWEAGSGVWLLENEFFSCSNVMKTEKPQSVSYCFFATLSDDVINKLLISWNIKHVRMSEFASDKILPWRVGKFQRI